MDISLITNTGDPFYYYLSITDGDEPKLLETLGELQAIRQEIFPTSHNHPDVLRIDCMEGTGEITVLNECYLWNRRLSGQDDILAAGDEAATLYQGYLDAGKMDGLEVLVDALLEKDMITVEQHEELTLEILIAHEGAVTSVGSEVPGLLNAYQAYQEQAAAANR